MNNNIGFVFGNGESRLTYDLNEYIGKYATAGCNALYRHYQPDILIAGDDSMIEEVLNSRYNGEFVCISETKKRQLVIRKRIDRKEWSSKETDYGYGWSAGPTAIRILCERNPDFEIINLLGFDLYGIEGKMNNVYKGTRNYLSKHRDAVKEHNWVKQLGNVFALFPHIKFFRVGNNEDEFPVEWMNNENIIFVDYPVFDKDFK